MTTKADGGVVAAGATGYGSPVYEALREIAFYERRKIHDLIMEGIDAVLKQISICRGPQSGQKAMNEPLPGLGRRSGGSG